MYVCMERGWWGQGNFKGMENGERVRPRCSIYSTHDTEDFPICLSLAVKGRKWIVLGRRRKAGFCEDVSGKWWAGMAWWGRVCWSQVRWIAWIACVVLAVGFDGWTEWWIDWSMNWSIDWLIASAPTRDRSTCARDTTLVLYFINCPGGAFWPRGMLFSILQSIISSSSFSYCSVVDGSRFPFGQFFWQSRGMAFFFSWGWWCDGWGMMVCYFLVMMPWGRFSLPFYIDYVSLLCRTLPGRPHLWAEVAKKVSNQNPPSWSWVPSEYGIWTLKSLKCST